MIEMADIFRQYKGEYLRKFGDKVLPSHRRTIDDIIACRTPALGGNLYSCPSCGKKQYSYHSCGNRHCPKCGNDDATRWVEKQSARIPEVPCFLITFTLPHELNKVVRSNQKNCYGLLFRASSNALKKLAADPRHLGAQPGMLGVLHTWGRDLPYHPHVHYLVPGGGINKSGKWVRTPYEDFFLPVRALSPIYRGKFRDGMKALGLYDAVPEKVWKKDWKLMTLPVLVFMARFLQHVLPKGLCKVRYYGFLHQRCTDKLTALREQLGLPPVPLPVEKPLILYCSHCGTALEHLLALQRMREPP